MKCGVKHSCYYVCFEVAAFDSKPEVLHKQNVVLLENTECLLSELAYKYMNQNKASKNSLLSNAHNNIPQNQWKIIAAQKREKKQHQKNKTKQKTKNKKTQRFHTMKGRGIFCCIYYFLVEGIMQQMWLCIGTVERMICMCLTAVLQLLVSTSTAKTFKN